jgi:hypothetical protein
MVIIPFLFFNITIVFILRNSKRDNHIPEILHLQFFPINIKRLKHQNLLTHEQVMQQKQLAQQVQQPTPPQQPE